MNPIRIPALALIALLSIATTTDVSAAEKQRSPRGALVHDIVMKWGNYIQETYRTDVRRWAMEMVPLFSKASLPSLRRAAEARTYEEMQNALLARATVSARDASALPTKALGDTFGDLSFTPVTPCRILDTRNLDGPAQADSSFHMDISGLANFSLYGGANGNCNISNIPNIAALAVNFTVVSPAAPGYITAYPFNQTKPLAATVNYATGEIRGNFAIVPLDQTSAANELSIYSYAQTHVVADVVGYFIRPERTALACVNVDSPQTVVNANSFGTITTNACPTDYIATGGGCETGQNAPLLTSRMTSINDNDVWKCVVENKNNSFVIASAYTRCCRVPGR
jgi:hypothetical protein